MITYIFPVALHIMDCRAWLDARGLWLNPCHSGTWESEWIPHLGLRWSFVIHTILPDRT